MAIVENADPGAKVISYSSSSIALSFTPALLFRSIRDLARAPICVISSSASLSSNGPCLLLVGL